MKRIIATVLCVILLLMTLASCESQDAVTVTTSSEISNISSASSIEEVSSQVSSEVSAASSESNPKEVSSEVSSTEDETEEIDIHHIFTDEDIVGVIPENLPEYVDGSIELYSHDKVDYTPPHREKRHCYYGALTIFDSIRELGNDDLRPAYKGYWNIKEKFSYDCYGDKKVVSLGFDFEPEEMPLVTFIKYFNIPREVMERELEEYRNGLYKEWIAQWGEDYPQTEYGELPNLDIIYTLDNDIINEYYRYA